MDEIFPKYMTQPEQKSPESEEERKIENPVK
jgi:hypothetical protein